MAIVDPRGTHAMLLTETVMVIVEPFITDVEGDAYRKARRALFEELFKADVRVSTAATRL